MRSYARSHAPFVLMYLRIIYIYTNINICIKVIKNMYTNVKNICARFRRSYRFCFERVFHIQVFQPKNLKINSPLFAKLLQLELLSHLIPTSVYSILNNVFH